MAGPTAMVDAPMMAVVLMCWLLIAALVVVCGVVIVKWILKRMDP